MMYEELIKRLKDYSAARKGEIAELTEEAADAIEKLQRQIDGWIEQERKVLLKSTPKWIPVTERLPTKRNWVLCWCVSDTQEVLRWENNEWYPDPKHVYFSDFVTHWMPLPTPPKEET